MAYSAQSISVLCVDDEPGLADLAATFLERSDDDLTTSTAESAQEGLDYLDENHVDCIVSDHDMPGMDGLEFLKVVRETYPEISFILFTGHGSEEIASDAISAGVSDYIQKQKGNEQYVVLGQRIHEVVGKYHSPNQKPETATSGTDQADPESVLREMYNIISSPDQPFEEQVGALLELGRQELDVAYGTFSQIQGDDYIFEVVDADDNSIQAGDVVPVSATNCEIVASTEQTLVLGDIERDAPEETDRAGYDEWGIACYLGAPVSLDNEVYGTFCFYDTEPRAGQFSEWEVTLVDLMSRWVGYELQRQQDTVRLQDQNDKLEEFAALVSHDLRNPLNVLEGYLELAEETGDADHFQRCYRATDRMDALIDDLLSLARAGSMIDETETVSFGSLVEECWQTVEMASGTLQMELDTGTTIEADKSRLKQILENLIRNAFEHGNDETTVTIGALADGFYVADDGPGIPEDKREVVFESGFSTSDNGTGFGLSIVREIVEAHGWEIRVTDAEAGGAQFEISDIESE